LNNIELNAKTRTTKGNSPARAMRREGRVPAVLYGPNTEPAMVSVEAHDLETIIKGGGLGRSIFNLRIDGAKKGTPVMIKELQTHPVSNELLHIDLYKVSMDREVRVAVPIVTTGKSIGVEAGGVLQIIRRELEVACRPDNIPESIVVDITELDIGHSIHVEDIETTEDVEILHDVNFTVLTVATTKQEEEAVEEVEGEEGEEVEAAEGEAAEEAGED